MKNLPFYRRVRYAIAGILITFRTEASFRTQSFFSLGAALLLGILRPEPIWWALVLLTVAGVLAAELINTSIEVILDRLHPEEHPLIARAKDCAAGAVLVLSLSSVGVALALVWDYSFGN